MEKTKKRSFFVVIACFLMLACSAVFLFASGAWHTWKEKADGEISFTAGINAKLTNVGGSQGAFKLQYNDGVDDVDFVIADAMPKDTWTINAPQLQVENTSMPFYLRARLVFSYKALASGTVGQGNEVYETRTLASTDADFAKLFAITPVFSANFAADSEGWLYYLTGTNGWTAAATPAVADLKEIVYSENNNVIDLFDSSVVTMADLADTFDKMLEYGKIDITLDVEAIQVNADAVTGEWFPIINP